MDSLNRTSVPSREGGFGLRRAELIMTLSLATDLGTGNPMDHALCSALVGVRFGQSLGMRESALCEIYYLALLRHAGCTAEIDLTMQLLGSDPAGASQEWALLDPTSQIELIAWMLRRVGRDQGPLERLRTLAQLTALGQRQARAQCETGMILAERLGLDETISRALWFIYERWDGKGDPNRIVGEAIPLPMRIVHIVQDAEQFRHARGDDEGLAMLRARAGSVYDPTLVEAFCRFAPAVYASVQPATLWEDALAAEPGEQHALTEAEFDGVLLAMSDFGDMVSTYTVGHSRRLATLVEAAAPRLGLTAADAASARRAALLHDLGKVGIAPGIWNKPRGLTVSEMEKMRLHPYYTERILARPAVLARLGTAAAMHHERIDGSGYPRNLRRESLSPVGMLLAAANHYQARLELRPHRIALAPDAAAEDLRREVRAGRLDGDSVRAVLEAAGHHVAPIRRERVAGLSDREIEVLRLIARGMSNRQMAAVLTLSEKTVGNHIMHIYEKISVSTRAAATLFALQNHLLEDVD